MSLNYDLIRAENEKRYGTDIARTGRMLLADRYDDRTHFIFELLQNAEDALKRRGEGVGPREISFTLDASNLTVSHFGQPFDERDVRGVCGIAESTKDEHSIGRFGIGFKSVYTFTDKPEVHSGTENFAIESYVWPTQVAPRQRADRETLIILPLRSDDETAQTELIAGFQNVGTEALLFLKHIDQIAWSVEGGASGVYMRGNPEQLGQQVHRVTVIGQETDREDVDQTWLVFDRDVFASDGKRVGSVEIAFALERDEKEPDSWTVQPVAVSPLVVFFPTVVSTNLGFLVQGPYRTTPSRDNILRSDPWNQHLVGETSALLLDAMRWLRDENMLDVSALRCLPLDKEKFSEGAMFAPLYEAVSDALKAEPLLPKHAEGYVAAAHAKLARTQEIRELFAPEQIAALYDDLTSAWLSGDITLDRTPEVREYLLRELDVTETTPAGLIPRLSKEFLEAQSDEWLVRLYEFLGGQVAALSRRLDAPLVRLTDGTHVAAKIDGKASAFLPSTFESGFPTVRLAVCSTPEARAFLGSLGLTEPDPVDDVIWNLLPKYERGEADTDAGIYAADIERIRTAYETDSAAQREKLLMALRETNFLMVTEARHGQRYINVARDTYLATDRLKALFRGVPGVFLVDDSYACLRGEPMRDLLEACGGLRYLRAQDAPHALSSTERRQLRIEAGHEQTSGVNDRVVDWKIRGLDELLNTLTELPVDDRVDRARQLWESLCDLEERRGHAVFQGTYSWSHYGTYRKEFPSAFVRALNKCAWIPDDDGVLQTPSSVVFETLGWRDNPFLRSRISFKPALVAELAREIGIEPAALDLLKRLGLTSLSELTSRLGIIEDTGLGEAANQDDPTSDEVEPPSDVYGDASDLYGDDMPDIPAGSFDTDAGDDAISPNGSGGKGTGGPNGGGANAPNSNNGNKNGGNGKDTGRTSGRGGRPFVSYVASLPDEQDADPDGLDQATRMTLESRAIDRILEVEPHLRRTAAGNAGFDLFEEDEPGSAARWIEVKAMTGTLSDRPVGLSRTQFTWATQKGKAYWLYVVENAASEDGVRILRIQDPATNARTFTFDRGWANIAVLKPPPRLNRLGTQD